MTAQATIERLNTHRPPFIAMMQGQVVALELDENTCEMEFNLGTEFCHSIDVVQGGFVTAMLDAAMSHCIFGCHPSVANVSSLEIKTSFLEPTRAGRIRAIGHIIKAGYKTAFLEGRLYNDEGLLTATASTVAKLVRDPTPGQ